MIYMNTTHPASTATKTCNTCGKAFDPELDDLHDYAEIEDTDGEMVEAIRCGDCADPYIPPTGHYEFFRIGRRMHRTWVED